jgi:type I restriction enzyme S subunit
MSNLGSMLTLEYGEALPAEARSGDGFPVFGSNGEVGRHRKFLIPEPGIIVGRKGSVGKVTWSDEPFWPIDTTYWVRCASEDRHWIYWVLTWLPLARLDSSTGVPGLNRNDVYALTVERPGRSAREKIAEILDTLETAIHETEAIIAKLKAVKQGLLHDLLTRGIDANGELRPPQSEAPHLYKQSPLGWIPKEWEEISLGDIARRSGGLLQTGPFGSQLHAHEYTVEGIPVVMPQDMVDGEVSAEQIARITERKASALARHRLKPNDVVFSRRGDLSRCVAIDERQAGWVCGTGCLLARLPASEVNAHWLALVYQQPVTQSQVMGRAVGSTMANLNTSILAAISIARPTVIEQNEIAKRIASTSLRIRTEERTLQKLRLDKAGLMDDLLAGRVRVTPLLTTIQGSS